VRFSVTTERVAIGGRVMTVDRQPGFGAVLNYSASPSERLRRFTGSTVRAHRGGHPAGRTSRVV
jgi:hypothetical protein